MADVILPSTDSASLDNTSRGYENATTAGPPALSPVDFVEYDIYIILYRVTVFTALGVGTPCNVLSLLVMLRPNMRRTSSSVYFAGLAIWDTLTIWSYTMTMLSRFYLPQIVSKNFCKLVFLWQASTSTCSAWTVAAMTFERLLVVTFPLKAIRWCTVKRARITLVAIFIVFLVFSVQYLVTGTAHGSFCGLDMENYGWFMIKWTYVESVVVPYMPITIVIICNILIVRRMKAASTSQQQMTGGGRAEGGTLSAGDDKVNKEKHRAKKQMRQITVILLTVSITFAVFNIPFAVFFVFSNVYPYYEDPHEYAITALTQQVCILLQQLNFSLNFALYCLTGRKFRDELLEMFGCRRKQNGGQRAVTSAVAQRPISTGSTGLSTSQVTVSVKSNDSQK